MSLIPASAAAQRIMAARKMTRLSHINEFIFRFALRKHRERVFYAKSVVNTNPPNIKLNQHYMKYVKMRNDVDTCKFFTKQNMKLNVHMNRYQRTDGKVDTFQTEHSSFRLLSRVPQMKNQLRDLAQKNVVFGKRLLNIKSSIDSRYKALTYKQRMNEVKREIIAPQWKYPDEILMKYDNLKVPRNLKLLKRLLRPTIYMDVELKGGNPLGRIIIQLFTEACPQVVLEFVRVFTKKENNKINFRRLFPYLWLEGELQLPNDNLNTPKIEYDMRALDNGKSSGILSFARDRLNGFRNGLVDFAISFKKLNAANGRRVAFGHLIKGIEILNYIESWGSQQGTPKRELLIKNLGLFK